MPNSDFRQRWLLVVVFGTYAVADLVVDYLISGELGLALPHAILAAVVVLLSLIVMRRAAENQSRATALISNARDKLEARVHERTAELERANQALRTSEETARALIDVMPDSAVLLDTEGHILAANQAVSRNFGTTTERLIGSSLFDLFPPDVAEARLARMNAVLESRLPLHFVDERNGRTFDNHVNPVLDVDGNVIRLAVFGQDITEHLAAQSLLRNTIERLEFTMAAAGAGSWDWDTSTGRHIWSPKMFELLGADMQTTVASFELWRSVIHPDDRDLADAGVATALEAHAELDSEYRVILPDGQIRWINALGEGAYDDQGLPTGMSGICLDVTDHRRADEMIRYLSSFPKLNPNPVLEVDAAGTVTYANLGAIQVLEQLGLQDDVSVFMPGDLSRILPQLERGNEVRLQREVRVGGALFAETIQVIPSAEVMRIYAFDITERKRAEDALRASEEKYRLLFQNMAEGFAVYEILYDEQGQPFDWVVLEVNDAYTRHTGIAREEIAGRRISELFPAAIPQYLPLFAQVVATGVPNAIETYAEAVGRHQHVTTFPAGGHRFASVIEDITARKRSEDALRKAQADLAEDIRERSAINERQRLARELHDSVSQALYGISLGLNTALRIFDTDRPKALEALRYALDLAQGGLKEMRALIFELRPESLASEGLVVAITKHTEAVRARYGIDLELMLCDEPNVPLLMKEALYRIEQEAVQNAVKHAKAKRVEVCLASDSLGLSLDVRDDGVGFDPGAAYPGHLGLHSMQERAQGAGGTLEILSEPGRGAHVRVRMPLVEELLATSN